HQTPLQIAPLTKTEIIQAFDQRMLLLQSEAVSGYTKPVENGVIFHLYDLYNGDIRSIMGSVRDIVGQLDSSGRPLKVEEAMVILGRLRWEEINDALKLTDGQIEVLRVIIESKNYVSQKQISKILGKSESNMSGYYFKTLKENGIIEEKERHGKEILFGLTSKYVPLKEFVASQQKLREEVAGEEQTQMDFFMKMP
ncbi:MAG: helix-turn-helix domain-containing protein, partial [Patescibacteria group bacterium]